MKYLISGGGTGGHIFPAVSIANALRELDPNAEILFVGALGRMEMERVPQAGYKIIGLPVRGFNRAQPCYASGAAMKVAAKMGVPILLQEQNGFAGVTNKLLKDDASVICVAYDHMERFFPAEKIILTGNPVRQNLTKGKSSKKDGEKNLLIIGGSLGARTINESIIAALPLLAKSKMHIVWQTGKVYFDKCKAAWQENGSPKNIECLDFLSDMPDRYATADLVISRAGASSISELCLLGKPAILVPSPNVAEDHQTHNAMALVEKNAAVLVKDIDARNSLVDTALTLIQDDKKLETLHKNILALAQPDSAKRIAQEVIKLTQQK